MTHIAIYKRVNKMGIRVKVKLYFDKKEEIIILSKLLLLNKATTEFKPEAWKHSVIVKETDRYIMFSMLDAFYGETFAMIVNDLINSKLLHPRQI